MKNNGAIQTQTIRVVYPGEEGRIVLRTDHDWERDLEARTISREDCFWEFTVETAQPFFYFKPLLIRNGSVDWSRGENYLAVATSGTPLEIHPYFLHDAHCSVCELMSPLASPGGIFGRCFLYFFPGIGGRFIEPAEVYPNSEAWGVDGFTLTDKDATFIGENARFRFATAAKRTTSRFRIHGGTHAD